MMEFGLLQLKNDRKLYAELHTIVYGCEYYLLLLMHSWYIILLMDN